MGKLIVVAALLVALFAITQVYASRTIITTTTVVEEGIHRQSQQERCRQQIRERSRQSFEQQSHPCQMHLSQQVQSRDIAMIINRDPQQQQQHLQQCCQELKKIDQECRCQALQIAVDEQQKQLQQERGQSREQQIRQIQREAEEMPRRCEFRSPQRCQIQTQSS